MPEIVSITAAAQHFNISRPRLSKLIKEFDIAKIKQGTTFLVDLEQVQSMFDVLAAKGRLRKRSANQLTEPFNHTDAPDLAMILNSLQEMREEINQLHVKVKALSLEPKTAEKSIVGATDKNSFLQKFFAPWQ